MLSSGFPRIHFVQVGVKTHNHLLNVLNNECVSLFFFKTDLNVDTILKTSSVIVGSNWSITVDYMNCSMFVLTGYTNPENGTVRDACQGDSGGPLVREFMVDKTTREKRWIHLGMS